MGALLDIFVPDLNVLAARALDAKINGSADDAGRAQDRLVTALTARTGLSDNMLALLRMEGLLP